MSCYKCVKLYDGLFLGITPVKQGTSQEYDGINMDDIGDTSNAPDVYRDLQGHPSESAGRYCRYNCFA